jgi:hypothetical protein
MDARSRFMVGCFSCVLMFCAAVRAAEPSDLCSPGDVSSLPIAAISSNAEVADPAIAQLRGMGPSGLAAMMSVYQDDVASHVKSPNVAADPNRWQHISSALDRIAQQRDAWACGLYWYTDLPSAEAAAKASGKPILSLHMLGHLDQELSCANSRFFRTTLYPNRTVQDALRDGFILHWQSERPVPTVTIDFGDGRKIVRTITGNSVHYVLDSQGRVIDALPGLYGVQPFLRQLKAAAATELALRDATSDTQRETILRSWHRQQMAATDNAVRNDLSALHLSDIPATDDLPGWQKLGALHFGEMQVDQGVLAVMIEKNPDALRAGRMAIGKSIVENPIVKAVRNLESTIAQDCMRNEYVLHRQIHQMLADGGDKAGLDAFNENVYSRIFLTPRSDPWLGLAPPDAYSALDHDGLVH